MNKDRDWSESQWVLLNGNSKPFQWKLINTHSIVFLHVTVNILLMSTVDLQGSQ